MSQGVDRREERDRDRGQPEQEQRCAPYRPSLAARARDVERGRGDEKKG
jgi:hypothetical protein